MSNPSTLGKLLWCASKRGMASAGSHARNASVALRGAASPAASARQSFFRPHGGSPLLGDFAGIPGFRDSREFGCCWEVAAEPRGCLHMARTPSKPQERTTTPGSGGAVPTPCAERSCIFGSEASVARWTIGAPVSTSNSTLLPHPDSRTPSMRTTSPATPARSPGASRTGRCVSRARDRVHARRGMLRRDWVRERILRGRRSSPLRLPPARRRVSDHRRGGRHLRLRLLQGPVRLQAVRHGLPLLLRRESRPIGAPRKHFVRSRSRSRRRFGIGSPLSGAQHLT